MDTSTKTVGYKEGSGFTHAYNDEPITFNPMEAHEGIRDVRCVIIMSKVFNNTGHIHTLIYFRVAQLLIITSILQITRVWKIMLVIAGYSKWTPSQRLSVPKLHDLFRYLRSYTICS